MKLTTFNGGLNTRVDPHLIQDNQGVVYKNIDDSKGTLTPVKDKLVSVKNAKKFGVWFEAKKRWVFSDNQISWAEFQEVLYYADGKQTPKKVIGDKTYSIGIQPPERGPNILLEDDPTGIDIANVVFDSLLDFCIQAPTKPAEPGLCTDFGSLRQNETYEYKFVTLSTEGKTVTEAVSYTVPAYSGSEISQLTAAVLIQITDPNFDESVEVYRLYKGKYRLVGVLLNNGDTLRDSTLNISSNETLAKAPSSINLNGTYTYAVTFYSSISGFESQPSFSEETLVENKAAQLVNIPVSDNPEVDQKKIYRIGGNLTDYSLVAIIDNDTKSYTDDTPDNKIEGSILTSYNNSPPKENLRYLIEAYGMLFGAVNDKLYFTPIGVPDAWPEAYYLDFPTEITGIGEVPIGLIICTKRKTYLVTGTGPNSLAQQLLDGSEGCVNHYTMQNLEGAAVWVSYNGICVSNGGGIINATKSKMDRLELDPVNAVVFDKSYYVQLTSGEIFTMDADAQTLKYFDLNTESLFVGNNLLLGYESGTLHELFAGSDYLPFEFKSAEFANGGLTQQKLYKNVYANVDGQIKIDAYLNGELVQSLEYNDTDIVQFKFNQHQSKGYKLQFAITGTGRLLELDVEVKSANV